MLINQGCNALLQMTQQERISTKFSQNDNPQLKDKTKAELFDDLKSGGVGISVVKWEMVGDLKDISVKK